MSVAVVNSDSAVGNLGASFRRTRPGPEADLVEWFLEEFPVQVPRHCQATVLCEPRLESGFPDLVIVIWSSRIASNWNSSRAELTRDDYRVVQYLHHCGRTPEADLVGTFGQPVVDRLARLESAQVVRAVADDWVPVSLTKTYAARRIIAVEAKVSEWAVALSQAVANTWFASESYVLVPQVPRGDRLLESAKPHGVGVCTRFQDAVALPAAKSSNAPRSYASWILNDWAWRAWACG